ncbi:MAG: ankyrin repeat domain-containing protein [Verrucomicrobia bacterium]|nr:ankyrin repeat domain-containing protein [Verrucomicrobiota bacterium]
MTWHRRAGFELAGCRRVTVQYAKKGSIYTNHRSYVPGRISIQSIQPLILSMIGFHPNSVRMPSLRWTSDRKIKMKTLITTIAAVLVVGCATTQQPEPPTAKAPDISIHDAIEKGNIEAVKQHLAAGTDVEVKDGEGWTLLQIAAGEGHKEIAELLIAKGADVNAMTADGLTALFAAILGSHKEMAELLITKGADVNARGFLGMTLLNMAVDEGEKEIADLLRKHGGKTGAELKAEGK